MNGRLENENKIEKSIDNKLKTLPDFAKPWHMNLKASQKTASTRLDYLRKLYRFLYYINPDVKSVTLDDITEENVYEYYSSIQTTEKNGKVEYTSDSYKQTVWFFLDNFLEYEYKHNNIKMNYMSTIDKPKNKDLERINENRILLTEKDFKNIIASTAVESDITLRTRDKAILLLFMNTGMRRTALCNIMLDDLNYINRELNVIDKGNKRHVYYLNEQTYEAISKWLKVRNKFDINNDSGHLFISERGNVIAGNTIYKIVSKYTQLALGKKISPHKLRSGYCSILYKKTGDIEFVRRAVGHANATTTQRYIVTKGEEKRKASEIMGNIF